MSSKKSNDGEMRSKNSINLDFDTKKKNRIYNIILVIALICICIGIVWIGANLRSYRIAQKTYETVRQEVTNDILYIDDGEYDFSNAQRVGQYVPDDFDDGTSAYDLLNGTSYTVADLDALRALYPNVIGWIQIPGTNIDYPIVQGTDDEYYLTHSITGEKSSSGAIWLAAEITEGLNAKNPVIFGHNMKSGAMFQNLNNYRNQSYWNAHPYVYITTDDGTYLYEVFSAYETSGSITLRYAFADEDSFMEYCNELIAKSVISTNITILPSDQIITLSVCATNSSLNHHKFIVHAVRMYKIR